MLFQSTFTQATYLLYFSLSVPAFVVEFWFEKIGRPSYGSNGELIRPGEDLDAKGLTEYMFDVLYWSLGTTLLASIFGEKAWWLWTAIPLYSAWLGFTTFGSMRESMAGMAGMAGLASQNSDVADASGATSNRQKKLEKRGGQRVQYR